MIEAYKLLVEKLHPLSIGNVYRAYRMGKILSERLLRLHMENKEREIKKIIKEMTGDITIHAYPIDRDEATELGLKVEKANETVDKTMRELYTEYAKLMKLGQPFNPNEILKGNDVAEIDQAGAFLESSGTSHQFTFRGKIQKAIRDNQSTVDMSMESQKWEKT